MRINKQFQAWTKQNYGLGQRHVKQVDQSSLARAFRGELG